MFGGQFGPVAQPTDMRDVAQADGCNAMSACLVDTDFGGRFGGKLAETEIGVIDVHGIEFGDLGQFDARLDGAVTQLIGVLAYPDQPVGIVAHQIRVGQPESDTLGLGFSRAGGQEDALNDGLNVLGCQLHGVTPVWLGFVMPDAPRP